MTTEQKIQYIADHYGYEPQSRQLIEEMSELTVAINKYWRSKNYGGSIEKTTDAEKKVIEEMADVHIMLLQLRYLLDCDDYLLDVMDEKLDRQIERINHEC